MSLLVSRILVAAVLLPLVIGLVYLGDWWLFGLALVLVMLYRPAGLLPSAVRKRELEERAA